MPRQELPLAEELLKQLSWSMSKPRIPDAECIPAPVNDNMRYWGRMYRSRDRRKCGTPRFVALGTYKNKLRWFAMSRRSLNTISQCPQIRTFLRMSFASITLFLKKRASPLAGTSSL